MKKLNTIFSFVLLSFCLFINVSYAIPSGVSFSVSNALGTTTISGDVVPGYTDSDVCSIVTNYRKNPNVESYKIALEEMLSVFDSNGIQYVLFSKNDSNNYKYLLFCDKSSEIDFFTLEVATNNIRFGAYFNNNSGNAYVSGIYGSSENLSYVSGKSGTYYRTAFLLDTSSVEYSNVDVYSLTYVTDNNCSWDGESYFYKAPTTPDEPETPTMPTNAEIASAVQMFYNSVYNLPNIAFDDFIVLYDNTTGLYTYIGHTLDTALGQVIVEPNGYYEGYKYDIQWWKFFIDEQNNNFLDQFSNYYVYTSDGTIDNLKYIGDSNISGLIEKSGPWATSNTVIVYSTNDYPVKYVTFSDDSPDPTIQTGTIQGDQYTYDENLDITDNQYNPLDNFISINYPSTLVGNADFDSFLNTFDENKDVLILPQNANWIILANTSLFSYFGSFIIMCTLFIIIERIMRG